MAYLGSHKRGPGGSKVVQGGSLGSKQGDAQSPISLLCNGATEKFRKS